MAVPQRMLADENENTSLYMVSVAGLDQLKFEMPVYDDAGYDGWIDDGNVYVTPEGGIKQTLLHYHSKARAIQRPRCGSTRVSAAP